MRPVYRVAKRRGSINFPSFYHWLGILCTHYKMKEQERKGGEVEGEKTYRMADRLIRFSKADHFVT